MDKGNFGKPGAKKFAKKPFGAKPFSTKPGAKPHGERPTYSPKPYGDKPQGDKPAYGAKKPYAPKPYGDKPQGDKPAYGAKKPYAPKPYGDKPQGDKPAYGAKKPYAPKPYGDKPAYGAKKPYSPKPYGDKPQGDKPAYGAKKPYAPKPYGDRPQGDKPAYSPKPYAPKPYGDRPQGDKPAYSPKPYAPKPYGDKPQGDKPAYSPKPYAPKPYGDKPQGDKPAYSPKPYAPKPYGDRPQGDKPAYTPKPYAPKPYGDRPQGDKPAYSPKPYAPKPYGDKPQGDKPAYSPKPYAPKPYGDKPQGDKPAYTPKPYAPKPYGDRPQGDKPAYSPKPYAPKPYGDRPQGDKPAYSPKPYAPKPPIGAPRVDQATEAKPAFDKPRTFAKPRSFDKPRHGDKPANAPKQGMGMDSRKLALLALSDVVRGKAYSQLALDERLRASSISPEDKRLSTMIFYAALENRLRISWVLKQFVESMPEDVVEDIFHIAAAQLLFLDRVPDHAVVDEAVKQVKALGREHFAPLVNGTLRTLIRARNAEEIRYPVKEDDEVKYLSVMHSLPEALSARLIADYGMEEAEQMIAYRPDEHTQTVRPNLSKMDDAQFEQYLTERGWSPRKGIVPHAFHITAAGDLGSDPAFREGLFSMQGEGSMLPCYAMAPRPGETILDCCAAPGGKAALLSELMGETGRVQAWELHEHRAELMRAMKKRLRLDNLRIAVRDATISREECVGEFDAVLVDAPCSGLGVMVNKPDIKYRVTEDDITLLTQLQKKILDACAPYVRVGGRLVYATCTVIKDENERQAAAFLERHPEFMADPDGSWLPEALRERFHDGQIQLQAHKDQMEGFFVARFVRTEGSR